MSSMDEEEVFVAINSVPDSLLCRLGKLDVPGAREQRVLDMCVLALWSSHLRLAIFHGAELKEDTELKEIHLPKVTRQRFAELTDDLKVNLKHFYRGPTLERSWL